MTDEHRKAVTAYAEERGISVAMALLTGELHEAMRLWQTSPENKVAWLLSAVVAAAKHYGVASATTHDLLDKTFETAYVVTNTYANYNHQHAAEA